MVSKFTSLLVTFALVCDTALAQAWPWSRNSGVEENVCPPPNFDAKKNVDLESFISARWYSIKQKQVFYQPDDEFYCVFAEYAVTSRFCPFCGRKPRISVYNQSQRGSVSGDVNSINFGGVVTDAANNPGKLAVAPLWIAGIISLFGVTSYWVVDAGTDEDIRAGRTSTDGTIYDWAIITAGAPDEIGANNKCAASNGQWIFHRNPQPDSDVIAAIEARADSLGLDTTQLLPVEQAGCTYGE